MPPAHALTHKGFLPLLSNQERSSASVFETVFRCMFYTSVGYKVFHLIAKLRATVSAAFLRFRGRLKRSGAECCASRGAEEPIFWCLPRARSKAFDEHRHASTIASS